MSFPFYIAVRYLFSKKSRNIINVISAISMITVAVVSAALIILLSAFNGLEAKVTSLFNVFDPPLKVQPAQGKTFSVPTEKLSTIRALFGVRNIARTIEESVLFTYDDRQRIGVIKGVDESFIQITGLDSLIEEGSARLYVQGMPAAILAEGVASALDIPLGIPGELLRVYYPQRGKVNMMKPFREASALPAGVFFIQQEYNETFVIAPLNFVQELTGYENEITALEIDVHEDDVPAVREKIQKILGAEVVIKNRFEQHELMYKVMKMEKLAVFSIVLLIIIIASFNIIGTLTMLMVEKKKDIMVLWSMGADFGRIQKIYVLEGTLVSFIGAVSGIFLGIMVVVWQQHFAFVRLTSHPDSNPYPVELQIGDVLLTFGTVVFIGFAASWLWAKAVDFKKTEDWRY